MRKVILYIAVSLDGFIADRQGGVDWLERASNGEEDSGYDEFIQKVDTVLMGYKTYHQVTTQLSPDQWPYQGLTTYVLTHRHLDDQKGIHFFNGPLDQLLDCLKEEDLVVRRGRAGPPGGRGRPNRPDSFDHPACPAGGRHPLVRRAGGEYLPASD